MKYLISLIVFLVASILLMLPIPAKAEALRHQTSQMTLTLLDEPCAYPKIIAMLTDSYKDKFKRGDLIWQGQQLHVCWIPMLKRTPTEEQRYIIVDETGDKGFLLQKDFSVVEEI